MDRSHAYNVPFHLVWSEARRGKSIGRILTNYVLAQWREAVQGLVLDLACGAQPSYRRAVELDLRQDARVVGVDVNISYRPTVVADVTRPLPFQNECADVVILSSFLYIPPYPRAVLEEIRRVLKPQGILLLTAPLVFPYNPEPTDHWRFTEAGLRFLLRSAGLTVDALVPLGGRWTAATYLLAPFLRPRAYLAPVVYWLAIRADVWMARRFPNVAPCPVGYVVKGRKA